MFCVLHMMYCHTCILVDCRGSRWPVVGWREIQPGRGEVSMKKAPSRVPRLEREKEVVWIWFSVTRHPTSTTSSLRWSLGLRGTLQDIRGRVREECRHTFGFFWQHSFSSKMHLSSYLNNTLSMSTFRLINVVWIENCRQHAHNNYGQLMQTERNDSECVMYNMKKMKNAA